MLQLENPTPDILFLLLIRAEGVEILWLFIRSSPRLFQVFQHKRDIILTTVIRLELGREIENDARFALRLSRVKSRGLSKQLALGYIAEYQAGMTNSNRSLGCSDTQEYVHLWKMHQDVRFIAELFTRETLPIVAVDSFSESGINESDKTVEFEYSVDKISSTEKARIYRATYLYVIYSYLFYFNFSRPGPFGSNHITGQEQSHSFLTLFSAWQVEELSCINDFIQDQIRKKSQTVDYSFRNSDKEPVEWHERGWELEYFYTHSVRVSYHQDWQGYLATFPLSELRKFFTADPKQLRETVLQLGNYYRKDFLPEALSATPYHKALETPEFKAQEEAQRSGAKVAFGGDSFDRPNEGWLWAHQYMPCDLYTEEEDPLFSRSGLRRFGYVFWDCERLRATGILERDPVKFSEATLQFFPRPANPVYSVEERLYYGAF